MSSPTSSFRLFGSLPAELRLDIWRLSCQPRVVEVRYHADADRCVTVTKPPSILHVNREARDEALNWYQQAFMTRSRREYIYFCPNLDVLYLPRHGFMGYDDSARDFGKLVLNTCRDVCSLAIDHVKTDIIRPWEPYNKFCLLQSFPNLTHAYLVFGTQQDENGNHSGGEIELIDPRGDPSAILRLIDGVIESFCQEVGPVACGLEPHEVPGPGYLLPSIPSLVPKAKVFRYWEEPASVVNCV